MSGAGPGVFGFGRDGHLTELALDRLDSDARADDPAFFEAAESHLAGCDLCRAHWAERRAADREVDIRPPARVMARVVALREPVRATGGSKDTSLLRAWLGFGLGALGFGAMAALATLVTAPSPDSGEPGFRAKGASLVLQVHVHDGSGPREVGDGDTIAAGERAAFAVRTGADGWITLFGWDATGRAYPIYPSGDGEDARATRAVPLARQEHVTALPGAVKFDATPGDEHLAAVWCPRAFALGDVVPSGFVVPPLQMPRGCAMRALVLHKRPR